MEQKIGDVCRDIEKEFGVKILFAIENGSRAWRMESKDSDYDVRFVYYYPLDKYISLKRPDDVIQRAFDSELNPCMVKGALIDIVGFDIFKFLSLLANSNHTTIEWLQSDIVYYGKKPESLKRFASGNFSRLALFMHYKSLCRNNYMKYIHSGKNISQKKYLYVYRGLLNAMWVLYFESPPPIIFRDVLRGLEDYLPNEVSQVLLDMIEEKKRGMEKEEIERINLLDSYVERFLDDDKVPETGGKIDTSVLDEELKHILIGKDSNI